MLHISKAGDRGQKRAAQSHTVKLTWWLPAIEEKGKNKIKNNPSHAAGLGKLSLLNMTHENPKEKSVGEVQNAPHESSQKMKSSVFQFCDPVQRARQTRVRAMPVDAHQSPARFRRGFPVYRFPLSAIRDALVLRGVDSSE